ncbi:hypothetical protein RRF57_011349 [Xylaria bambusicola]|uniref:Uncharacterized protein n=1 Tax=Xylaria bambusicola TaxID=326684 RepID=A0AAN7UTN1_9PEZI
MSDLWWLNDTVACPQNKWLTLVFVHKTHPASMAVDKLEADCVIVHMVRHGPCVGDADVRGNYGTTETRRYQVTIMHPRTTHNPRRVVFQPTRYEGMLRWWSRHRLLGRNEFDSRA